MADETSKSDNTSTPGGAPEPARAQPGGITPRAGAAALVGPFVGTDVDFDPLTGRLTLKGDVNTYMLAFLQNPAAGCFSGLIRVGTSVAPATPLGAATLADTADGGGDPPVVVDARC